jgi:hypothetical protein
MERASRIIEGEVLKRIDIAEELWNRRIENITCRVT